MVMGGIFGRIGTRMGSGIGSMGSIGSRIGLLAMLTRSTIYPKRIGFTTIAAMVPLIQRPRTTKMKSKGLRFSLAMVYCKVYK